MIKPTNEFWTVFKATNGALSVAESICIANLAAQAPKGVYIEFGTYKGKSALSAMNGLSKEYDIKEKPILHQVFYLVEPEFEKFEKEERENLINYLYLLSGEIIEIVLVSDYSLNILQNGNQLYSYVFVDSGSHQDGLPMQEVKLLEDKIIQGGIIAFHDCFAQFVEVTQAYEYLISTGKYEPIQINWDEINKYVNDNNLNEGNISWHHTDLENPNFVGAVKRI